MWAVCYDGAGGGTPLTFGEITFDDGKCISIHEPNRQQGDESSWDADCVEKYKDKGTAKRIFNIGHRARWSFLKK